MRGDWIYDWVQVELEYRAYRPPQQHHHHRKPPARPWAALRSALFTAPEVVTAAPGRAGLRHGD
jgi:hypothetical protein